MTNNFDKFYLNKSLFYISAPNNYNKLENIYLKTNNVNIKKIAVIALTNSTDISKLKYLVHNYHKLNIKEQDIDKFFCELIKNKLISDYAFDKFISKNSPIFKLDELVFIHFFKLLSSMLYDKDKINKLIFFLQNDLHKKDFNLKIKQSLDVLEWHKKI